VPGNGTDCLSVGLFIDGTTPEFSKEFLVLGVVNDVHLSVLVVFELRMVMHFLGNDVTSEKPDTFDVVVTLITNSGVTRESVFLEAVNSLHKTVKQVIGLEENLTFGTVLLVL